MNQKVTVVIFSFDEDCTNLIIERLIKINLVEKIIIVSKNDQEYSGDTIWIKSEYLFSGNTISQIIEKTTTPYLLFIKGGSDVELSEDTFNNFLSEAPKTNSGWIYSDYFEKQNASSIHHKLIDYQIGSIRDDFDFGYCFLVRIDFLKNNIRGLFL